MGTLVFLNLLIFSNNVLYSTYTLSCCTMNEESTLAIVHHDTFGRYRLCNLFIKAPLIFERYITLN